LGTFPESLRDGGDFIGVWRWFRTVFLCGWRRTRRTLESWWTFLLGRWCARGRSIFVFVLVFIILSPVIAFERYLLSAGVHEVEEEQGNDEGDVLHRPERPVVVGTHDRSC